MAAAVSYMARIQHLAFLPKKSQIGMNTVFPAVCQVQNYRELPGFFLGGDL